MSPETYRRLVAAGLSVDQVGVVLDIIAESESKMLAAEEARKSVARERVQRWREKHRDDDVTLQKRNGNATVRLTRAEANSSTQETSVKEVKEERTSPAARSTRGTRIPDDFRPDIEAAVAEGLSQQEAERQALSFCDYWRSKPGAAALKLDWPATWRMWFRRRIDEKPHQTAPPRPVERTMNDALEDMIRGTRDEYPGTTIETGFERPDRRSAPNLIQFDALSARAKS